MEIEFGVERVVDALKREMNAIKNYIFIWIFLNTLMNPWIKLEKIRISWIKTINRSKFNG